MYSTLDDQEALTREFPQKPEDRGFQIITVKLNCLPIVTRTKKTQTQVGHEKLEESVLTQNHYKNLTSQ